MKKTILNIEPSEYKKRIRIKIAVSLLTIILTLILNAVLIILADEDTKTVFMIINICMDIAVFSCAFFFSNLYLTDMCRKLKLYLQKDALGESAGGVIVKVCGSQRIEKFDCLRVYINSGGKERMVFVINRTFDELLRAYSYINFLTVNNIAVQAEVDDE